jgi:2'-5' RNA ligase
LVVVVPEAESQVGELRSQHDSSAALGVPAHITVLFPFLDTDEVDDGALGELLAGFAPFDFVLDRVERWEDGIVWLHPEPSQPFVDLTLAVWRRWPHRPPYGGAHDTVIPHLTVSETPIPVDVQLPIASHVDEIALMEEDSEGRWSFRTRFRLRG